MKYLKAIIVFLLYINNCVGQEPAPKLVISHLAGDFYIYTTYNFYKGSRIPANGMYLVTNKGVVMFDSPWDSTQFQPLLDSIKVRHQKNVIACIATHFHEDRSGGLNFYNNKGIATYTTRQTDELCRKNNKPRASVLIDKDSVFQVGPYSFETYYPGPGHTADNIVIWFEKQKILYGGCLIKSTDDNSLGNLADADVHAYAGTIKNVMNKCKKPTFMIPGHNGWESTRSLEHTYEMAKQLPGSGKN